MADENFASNEGGQDICSYLSNVVSHRSSVERLLNWLRESQTACTDTNCFDDVDGFPGTEYGQALMDDTEEGNFSQDSEPITLVVYFLIALLTFFAMNLSRNRGQQQASTNKSTENHHRNQNDHDDHDQYRRDNDHDQSSPAL